MQEDVIARNWRELIRPRRLEMEDDTLTATYGRFYCEPLERGFGTTLGNALRRVLLSSLQGAAITNIRINGVWPARTGKGIPVKSELKLLWLTM